MAESTQNRLHELNKYGEKQGFFLLLAMDGDKDDATRFSVLDMVRYQQTLSYHRYPEGAMIGQSESLDEAIDEAMKWVSLQPALTPPKESEQ